MNLLQDRRVQLAGGAGAAVLAGVAIAAFIMAKDKPPAEPVQFDPRPGVQHPRPALGEGEPCAERADGDVVDRDASSGLQNMVTGHDAPHPGPLGSRGGEPQAVR